MEHSLQSYLRAGVAKEKNYERGQNLDTKIICGYKIKYRLNAEQNKE